MGDADIKKLLDSHMKGLKLWHELYCISLVTKFAYKTLSSPIESTPLLLQTSHIAFQFPGDSCYHPLVIVIQGHSWNHTLEVVLDKHQHPGEKERCRKVCREYTITTNKSIDLCRKCNALTCIIQWSYIFLNSFVVLLIENCLHIETLLRNIL